MIKQIKNYMLLTIFSFLLVLNVMADTDNLSARELFEQAFSHNNTEKMELLLSQGEVVFDSNDLLFNAIENGKTEVAKLLIDYGIDVYKPQKEDSLFGGWPPLFFAIFRERKEIINHLIKKGIDVTRRMDTNNTSTTPLMLVASGDNVELVKLLLKNGAKANAVDHEGKTALIHAVDMASLANEQIVSELVKVTDLTIITKEYARIDSTPAHPIWIKPATVLTFAYKFNRDENIIDALLSHGATAGDTDELKLQYLIAFLKHLPRYKNNREVSMGCEKALSQVSLTTEPHLRKAIILLLASLYEADIIIDKTLDNQQRALFEKFAEVNDKSRMYLDMFDLISQSKKSDPKEGLIKWKKLNPNGIKGEWSFEELLKWANTLPKESKERVLSTINFFVDCNCK